MHKYYASRKRARLRWRHSDKGKAWDKAYTQRDYVKVKANKYHTEKKIKEMIDWMYSRDNPNQEKRWSKKIMLAYVLKQRRS